MALPPFTAPFPAAYPFAAGLGGGIYPGAWPCLPSPHHFLPLTPLQPASAVAFILEHGPASLHRTISCRLPLCSRPRRWHLSWSMALPPFTAPFPAAYPFAAGLG